MCVCVCVCEGEREGVGEFLISVYICELLDKKKEIKTFVCVIACNASNIIPPPQDCTILDYK